METKTLRENVAMRWLVLILVSAIMFATYWFQDFYGGLKGLMESELGFTSEQFGRIIGLTTIANMFGMIIIGGIILDKWGIRLAGYVFGGLAALGGAISAMATSGFFGTDPNRMLTWMILGRILFGSGLEVTCVVATRTIVKWFKGYEMALAMAINVGIGRLGSALGIAISPDIAMGHVSTAVSFAASLIGIGLLLFVVYSFFDIKIDKQNKALAAGSEEEFHISDLVKLVTDRSFIYITLLCVAFYAAVFPFIQYAPDMLVNKFGFTYDLPTDGSGDIFLFGSKALGNASIYVAFFLFGIFFSAVPANLKSKTARYTTMAVVFVVFVLFLAAISDKLSLWLQNGPKTTSLIPLGTILFTPIFGNYVDKKGKGASLMILGSILLIFAHLSLALSSAPFMAYIGLVCLGIAFSLVPASMWPSVAKIVPEYRLGTAYSTMFTVQNWGLGIFFWGIGALLDVVNRDDLEAIRAGEAVYDYTIPIFVLVACGVVAVLLAFGLKKADKEQGYGLEMPSGQR